MKNPNLLKNTITVSLLSLMILACDSAPAPTHLSPTPGVDPAQIKKEQKQQLNQRIQKLCQQPIDSQNLDQQLGQALYLQEYIRDLKISEPSEAQELDNRIGALQEAIRLRNAAQVLLRGARTHQSNSRVRDAQEVQRQTQADTQQEIAQIRRETGDAIRTAREDAAAEIARATADNQAQLARVEAEAQNLRAESRSLAQRLIQGRWQNIAREVISRTKIHRLIRRVAEQWNTMRGQARTITQLERDLSATQEELELNQEQLRRASALADSHNSRETSESSPTLACAEAATVSRITPSEELIQMGQFLKFLYSKEEFRNEIQTHLPQEISLILQERSGSGVGSSADTGSIAPEVHQHNELALGSYFKSLIQRNCRILAEQPKYADYLRKQAQEFSARSFYTHLLDQGRTDLDASRALIALHSSRLLRSAGLIDHSLLEMRTEHENARSALESATARDREEDPDDLLSDWQLVDREPAEDLTSLLQYSHASGQFKLSLHPILSPETYQDTLKFNDISYALANLHTSENQSKLDRLESRVTDISISLVRDGWNGFTNLYGATGASNQELDATCVASYNPSRNLVLIAFHGSRNGSKIPLWNDGRGDWGANYESTPQTASSLGIQYMPAELTLHSGFGKNFQSAQESIFGYLDRTLRDLDESRRQQTWVIITGHSKGAAVSSIAAPVIKSYLMSRQETQGVNVGAILLSAPRAFHSDDSRRWVHETLGKRNILRINVHGDPVPLVPLQRQGYRSIGMLVLDQITQTNERAKRAYGTDISGYFSTHGWAGYHYGCGLRGAGMEFDPAIVMTYDELLDGINQGRSHQESKGEAFLTQSFIFSRTSSSQVSSQEP